MLVKAKWNVKDANGWHDAGAVFETDADLGNAVEVLEQPAKAVEVKPESVPEAKPEPVKEEVKAERPRAATRRKKASE